MPMAEAVFVVDCTTAMGESVVLVGSLPEMGLWSAVAGIAMETSPEEYPTWRSPLVKMDLPEGDIAVEYKYVKAGPEGFFWEPGRNRTLAPRDCSGPDVECATIQDGHFNLAEKGRASTARIRKLRSQSSFSDDGGNLANLAQSWSRMGSEESLWKAQVEERQQEVAQKDGQIQKLESEIEALKVTRVQSERLRSELDSERLDRARSRARKQERSRARSRELKAKAAKADEIAAELKRAKERELELQRSREAQEAKLAAELAMAESIKAEAEKLKAELERERRERAASRCRHRTRTQELERLAEERAEETEQPAEEPVGEQPKLAPWQWQAAGEPEKHAPWKAVGEPEKHAPWKAVGEPEKHTPWKVCDLPEEMSSVQDVPGNLAKASSFYAQAASAVRQASSLEAQAAQTLRQVSRQESAQESEVSERLERSFTCGSEVSTVADETESGKQGREAQKQRRSGEQAQTGPERHLYEAAADAGRRSQRKRPARPLLLTGCMVLLLATGILAIRPARELASGEKRFGEWLAEVGDMSAAEVGGYLRSSVSEGYECSASALRGCSSGAQRFYNWLSGTPQETRRRRSLRAPFEWGS